MLVMDVKCKYQNNWEVCVTKAEPMSRIIQCWISKEERATTNHGSLPLHRWKNSRMINQDLINVSLEGKNVCLGISNWIVNLYVFYYYCNLWWMINFDVKLRMLKYCKIFSMYVSGVRVVLELRVSLSLNLWELISISNQECWVAEPNYTHFFIRKWFFGFSLMIS